MNDPAANALMATLQAERDVLSQRVVALEHTLTTHGIPVPVFPTPDAPSAQVPAKDVTPTFSPLAAMRLRLFEALVENALDGIGVADPSGTIIYGNRAFQTQTGFGEQTIGSSIASYFAPEDLAQVAQEVLPALANEGSYQGKLRYRRPDGSFFLGQISAFAVYDEENTPFANAVMVRDITAAVQSDAERNALQEQVLHAQQLLLRELSTPLLPIAEGVVLMPIIGSVDTARVEQMMETLLLGIAEQQAETAIVDISGVSILDTQVANSLVRMAQAAKLLGAHVIVSGISPVMAQTLVHLGSDLSTMQTERNLHSAIAYAFARAQAYKELS